MMEDLFEPIISEQSFEQIIMEQRFDQYIWTAFRADQIIMQVDDSNCAQTRNQFPASNTKHIISRDLN